MIRILGLASSRRSNLPISTLGRPHDGLGACRQARFPGAVDGFTLMEMLVVVAILLILAAIAVPRLIGARTNSANRACDAVYKALNGEIGNELNKVLLQGVNSSCGTAPGANPAQTAIDCALQHHPGEKNPRNRNQRVYTTSDTNTDATSCMVQMTTVGTNHVTFSQRLYKTGQSFTTTSRQFRTYAIEY